LSDTIISFLRLGTMFGKTALVIRRCIYLESGEWAGCKKPYRFYYTQSVKSYASISSIFIDFIGISRLHTLIFPADYAMFVW